MSYNLVWIERFKINWILRISTHLLISLGICRCDQLRQLRQSGRTGIQHRQRRWIECSAQQCGYRKANHPFGLCEIRRSIDRLRNECHRTSDVDQSEFFPLD